MTTSTEVPGRFPVAINGRPYLIDTSKYQRESIPILRQQSDTSDQPGEVSLNPRGLWRRSQESWHHGAGQKYLDGRRDGVPPDPARFDRSVGVDVWTKGQLSLLPATIQIRDSQLNSNLYLLPVGPYLYVSDGTALEFTANPTNLYPTGNMEGVTSPMVAGSGTTLAMSATFAHKGTQSLRLTQNSGTTISANLTGIPVPGSFVPGNSLSVGAWFRKGIAGSRTATIMVTWKASGGATIGTPTTTAVTSVFGSWTFGEASSPRPANAATVEIDLSVAGVGAAEQHYIDDVTFSPYGSGSAASSHWESVAIHGADGPQTVESLATDGSHIWAALGSSGLHRTDAGSFVATINVPAQACTLVGYAVGRLLIANANVLYEVLDPLGAPSAAVLMTHPNASFTWTFISPGRNVIYAGGNGGGNGEVYKVTLAPAGDNLGAPSAATYLPDGESVYDCRFYAGGVTLATSKGVRVGTADGSGNVDYGPLIQTANPVLCLEPQDRYVWFGLSRLDNTYSALGRLDLGFFTDPLTPAWATDIYRGGNPASDELVTSVCSYAAQTGMPPVRAFAVSKEGVYIEATRYTTTGDPSFDSIKLDAGLLETGYIGYSTSEPKTFRDVLPQHKTFMVNETGGVGEPDRITVEYATSEEAYAGMTWFNVGFQSALYLTATSILPFPGEGVSAEQVNLRFTLDNADESGWRLSRGPILTRWTLRALPTPARCESFLLPLILRSEVQTLQGDGAIQHYDVDAEVAALKVLEAAGTIVDFQVGAETLQGFIEDTQFAGEQMTPSVDRHMEGVMLVKLVTV